MKLIIGNDSSLIHLAAGVETPVLAIFGPTEPKATGPYPFTGHSVRRTELPCSPCGQRTCRNPIYLECLHTISVSSVLETMQEMMVPHN
jgi:ADP-heptose:LPS heptosyltransferase